jgi:hypothetical protein
MWCRSELSGQLGKGSASQGITVSQVAANIHVSDKKRWNQVPITSYHGHLDVVCLLIDTGTPVDILNGTQKTPMALASWKGEVEKSDTSSNEGPI